MLNFPNSNRSLGQESREEISLAKKEETSNGPIGKEYWTKMRLVN